MSVARIVLVVAVCLADVILLLSHWRYIPGHWKR